MTDLVSLRTELQSKIAAIDLILGGSSTRAGAATGAKRGSKGKRTMSAEGRAKIAAAARKRWAKAKREGRNSL